MTAPVLVALETRWVCGHCTDHAVTRTPSLFHNCRGLAGMKVPFVAEGADCVVELIPREDYVGDELVRVDANGRPWMSATTRYADGHNDLAVYFPTAIQNGKVPA